MVGAMDRRTPLGNGLTDTGPTTRQVRTVISHYGPRAVRPNAEGRSRNRLQDGPILVHFGSLRNELGTFFWGKERQIRENGKRSKNSITEGKQLGP